MSLLVAFHWTPSARPLAGAPGLAAPGTERRPPQPRQQAPASGRRGCAGLPRTRSPVRPRSPALKI